jgi:hypothetical protein
LAGHAAATGGFFVATSLMEIHKIEVSVKMMKMLNMMNMYPNFFGKIHPQHAVFMRPSDPGCTEQSIAQAPTPGPELP